MQELESMQISHLSMQEKHCRPEADRKVFGEQTHFLFYNWKPGLHFLQALADPMQLAQFVEQG